MSKPWWALAFVFLNQQTASYNVAQAVSQEVAVTLDSSLSWVKPVAKAVCPVRRVFLLTLCHPGRLAQPNGIWFCYPRQRPLTHGLSGHLAYFIIKPMMESLKDICQRWIRQRNHLLQNAYSRVHSANTSFPTQCAEKAEEWTWSHSQKGHQVLTVPFMDDGHVSLCPGRLGWGLFLRIVKSVSECPPVP